PASRSFTRLSPAVSVDASRTTAQRVSARRKSRTCMTVVIPLAFGSAPLVGNRTGSNEGAGGSSGSDGGGGGGGAGRVMIGCSTVTAGTELSSSGFAAQAKTISATIATAERKVQNGMEP